jgi:hypothetical protein
MPSALKPFPKVVRQGDYKGASFQIIESVPGRFIAIVHRLTDPDVMLMNPIRGDHFRHRSSAANFAKSFIRGSIPRDYKPHQI